MKRALFLGLLIVAASPARGVPALPEGCTEEAARTAVQTAARLPFGCANALNLRAMLAEPAATGVAAPPPVGEPAVRAIGRHRDGTVLPLPSAGSTDAPAHPGAR